jgi:hypothetical protein
MSAGTDPQTGRGPDHAVAFLDLFDPAFQPDAPQVHAAREACWYAYTPLGYAVLRHDEVAARLHAPALAGDVLWRPALGKGGCPCS